MKKNATAAAPAAPDAARANWLNTPFVLLSAYLVIWLGLAIAPVIRADWLLENLLVFAAAPTLVATHRRFPLTNLSYVCLFVFLVLHAIGAHYTYALVPYDRWIEQLGGTPLQESLGWTRNHFDRLVHFSYGLLVVPASIELLDRYAPAVSTWRWILPILFIASHSALFEMVEAIAAHIVAPDLGDAYLGTQGDSWDAQKDTALAILGAAIGTIAVRCRER
jgi:putative membrane protein